MSTPEQAQPLTEDELADIRAAYALYRLEACSVCGVVRLAIPTLEERTRTDRIEWMNTTPIYRVDFCKPCRRAYDESHAPPPEETR